MQTNLNDGITLFRKGKILEAMNVFKQIIDEPRGDKDLAWLWLAACVDNTTQKKYCLKKVLWIDPSNMTALSALNDLDHPTNIEILGSNLINSNKKQSNDAVLNSNGNVNVFYCPACGAPINTGTNHCEFCGSVFEIPPKKQWVFRELPSGSEPLLLGGDSSRVIFSPNDKLIASVSGHRIIFRNVDTLNVCYSISMEDKGRNRFQTLAFSPSGNLISLSIGYKGTILILDANYQEQKILTIYSQGDHYTDFIFLGFSFDGQFLIAQQEGRIDIFETNNWNVHYTDWTKGYWRTAIAFSPIKGELASSNSSDIIFHELSSMKPIITLHNDFLPYQLLFTPDGKFLLATSGDKVVLWDMKSFEIINRYRVQHVAKSLYSYAISPDSRTLISCSEDETILFTDIQTGNKLNILSGYVEGISSLNPCISISHDGNMLACASIYNTYLWKTNKYIEENSYPK